ncbi:LytR/AlgR family response regulator transcription factor [Algoriphagus boritolerans]|uniref:Two component transcriptional regulator, LytTR family n=1 Tax=Algoriphagus boritolerans DSM 17298 = JCM 18970 TaxID=1120964 RepID=A0A1H5ZI47_9BACT|nr:LytTR family DNA-binding domain-containing protein [Algoriphagus boritolerans]SEG35317.1 two component transcriptional regulator, LytTR family [Algoriphagus boritolerans DSM 17298 = JCM 18970]
MMHCVIVEDEPHSAERLLILLGKNHSRQITVDKWLKTPDEVLEYLGKNTPDLVFFDVEIKDQTAFELMSQLPKIDFKVIFTTAHQEYALKAIKVSALDYLLKPIDQTELAEAIQKVEKSLSGSDSIRQMMDLILDLKKDKVPPKIGLPTLFGQEYVTPEEIIRCQADVNYTHIFLKDGRKLTVAKTLKEYESILAVHGFFRVHNSHLVNLREVKFYNKGKGGFLILKDGAEVEVASRRKEALLRVL